MTSGEAAQLTLDIFSMFMLNWAFGLFGSASLILGVVAYKTGSVIARNLAIRAAALAVFILIFFVAVWLFAQRGISFSYP